jgi:hypothetical protein
MRDGIKVLYLIVMSLRIMNGASGEGAGSAHREGCASRWTTVDD